MMRHMLAGFTVSALGLTAYDWITSGGIDPYVALILIGSIGLFVASCLPGFNRSGVRQHR